MSSSTNSTSSRQILPLIVVPLLIVGGLISSFIPTGSLHFFPASVTEQTTADVQRIAAELDQRTTETGAYLRTSTEEIAETDHWGTPIQVSYSQGGMAETVEVRSAGPDREFYTKDDIVAQRGSMNLAGIGAGIKKNAEETASNTAKGLVKGLIAGAKESAKDIAPFQKSKSARADP